MGNVAINMRLYFLINFFRLPDSQSEESSSLHHRKCSGPHPTWDYVLTTSDTPEIPVR